jgi:tetratricopeptide (TPR) repeat protein
MSSNPDELRDEGRRLFRDGSMTEAIEHLQKALEGQAAEMLEKSRTAFSEAGDQDREAQTLGNLALLYKKQGNNTKALETYTAAADLFAGVNDKDKEGEILISRGLLEFEMGKRLDGITSYEMGLKMIKKPSGAQKRVLTMLKMRKAIMGN